VRSPSLVVADEPTGNLDSAAGDQVLDLLSGLVGEGTTVVMVTHSAEAAARAQRVVQLRDGRISEPSGLPELAGQ
jgi:ABC-type lipoprotein export system ATPase subunit